MSYKRGEFIVYRDKRDDLHVGYLQSDMGKQAMVVPWFTDERTVVKLVDVIGHANDDGVRFWYEKAMEQARDQAKYYCALEERHQADLREFNSRRGVHASSGDVPAQQKQSNDPLN
jgi:hypothetical protein